MKAKNVVLILAFVSIILIMFSFNSGAAIGGGYQYDPNLSPEENERLRKQKEAEAAEKLLTEKAAKEARERYADYKAKKLLSVDSGEGGDLVSKEVGRYLSNVQNRDFIYNELGVDGATEIGEFLHKYGTYFFLGDADEGWNGIIKASRSSTLRGELEGESVSNIIDAIFPKNSVQLDLVQKKAKNTIIATRRSVNDNNPLSPEQIRAIKSFMDFSEYGMKDFFLDRMILSASGKQWDKLDSIDRNEQVYILYSDFYNFLNFILPTINEYFATAKLAAIQTLRNDGFIFNGFDIDPRIAIQEAEAEAAANGTNTGRRVRDKMRGGN